VIKTHEAWVGKDGPFYIIEGMLRGIGPDWRDWIGVFIVDGELTQWSNPQFKVIDVLPVELHEAN
jgi:hypothetical protein